MPGINGFKADGSSLARSSLALSPKWTDFVNGYSSSCLKM